MKKLLCFLLSLVMLVGLCASVPALAVSAAEENATFQSPEALAEYIQSNLSAFTAEYNQENAAVSTYSLSATSEIFDPDYCEHQFSVQLLDTSEHAICMDFNDSNGYMIVSNDSILKLETTGDLNHLYDYDGEIYFSILDDDFVYCLDGEYFLFGDNDDEIIIPRSYAGAQSNGVITDKFTYLNDRYGETELSGYGLLSYSHLSYISQDTCSVYTNGYTEGNCAPVAILNFLNIMKKNGTFTTLPDTSATSTVIPTNDYFYSAALKNGYWVYHTTIPTLYYQIRQLAIASYGYTVTNGAQPCGTANATAIGSDTTVDFIETIGTYYGADINIKKKNTTMSNIAKQLDADKPVLWYTVNDSTYGNHAVVITGYTVHKQYTTVLGIKVCTNTINILRISNGWNSTPVYYDLESTSGKIFVFN